MGRPKQTRCAKGHTFTEDNTYITPSTGKRLCRTCRDEAHKKWVESHPQRDRSEYMMRWKHGITPGEYAALLLKQGSVCAICGNPPTGVGRFSKLWIDHDHKTDEIRGLLHHECNVILGLAKDNPDLLQRAANYLTTHTAVKGSV
jgi:hypothetical protein